MFDHEKYFILSMKFILLLNSIVFNFVAVVGFDSRDNKFFSPGTYECGRKIGVEPWLSIAVLGRDGLSGFGSLHDGNFIPIVSAGATIIYNEKIVNIFSEIISR